MPKGQTNQPLQILVHPSIRYAQQIVDLVDKGHDVRELGLGSTWNAMEVDLILGPNCWQMDGDLLKYVDKAVKAARVRKKHGEENSRGSRG